MSARKRAAARAEAGIAATAPLAGTPVKVIVTAAVSATWRVTVRASDLIVSLPGVLSSAPSLRLIHIRSQ
jgi:hypothetical protein